MKKRKLQLIKCYEAKRIQAGYANTGRYIHYMEKGKEAHLRIFFISIVENLVNAYQNIIFIQPFKGVVILLARKICS